MSETEITSAIPALDETGRPRNFGWARSPLFIYDPAMLRAPRRNVTESDRYIIFSPTHLFVFEILDDGYLGYQFVSVVYLRDKRRSTRTRITNFSLGCFDLPSDSDSGSIKIRQNNNLLNLAVMDGGVRIIKIDNPKFSSHRGIRGEVVLTPPPGAESLVTHMPYLRFNGHGRMDAFSYSRRSPWYSAEGVIQFGSSEIVFTKGSGWGIFDWNRGVRPRSDLRFWAGGCGKAGDHQAGFCIGYNSADCTQGTENAFFLDGKLQKLDQVTFHIPSGRLAPWRFTSNDSRLEMTFTPHQERDENHQMFLYSSKRRQLFGSFSGKAILDDGSEFKFQDITGMAERRKNRL